MSWKIYALAGLLALVLLLSGCPGVPTGKYTEFVECINQTGTTMYGTPTCLKCAKQREMLGDAGQLINEVNCLEDVALCVEKEIELTPTWIFPDGTRLVGVQELEVLSEKTGCGLPDAG